MSKIIGKDWRQNNASSSKLTDYQFVQSYLYNFSMHRISMILIFHLSTNQFNNFCNIKFQAIINISKINLQLLMILIPLFYSIKSIKKINQFFLIQRKLMTRE